MNMKAGGEPGDALVPAEQMLVDGGGEEREEHAGQDRMINAAVVGHAVEDEVGDVAHEQEGAERQQPQLRDRQLVGAP